MKIRTVTELLKSGYPHLKEYSGVSTCLLPERSFAVVVDGLGHSRIIESSLFLDLLQNVQGDVPEYDGSLYSPIWKEACIDWPLLSIVKDIIMAAVESIDQVIRKHKQGKLSIELGIIFRGFVVIAFAPFVPNGRDVLRDIATALECDPDNPPGLIRRYTTAILNNDMAKANAVSHCIETYQQWSEWANYVEQFTLGFNESYKVVAVTPPLSEGLAETLADMIKEGQTHGA